MEFDRVSPRRAKKLLAEVVENPEHYPVLIDTNMITRAGNKNITDILRNTKTDDVNMRDLKEARLYFSFLAELIRNNDKIKTINGVLDELDGFVNITCNSYVSRKYQYDDIVRDALRMQTHLSNVHSPFLDRFGELREIVSNLEQISSSLKPRCSDYSGEHSAISYFRGIANSAAKSLMKKRKNYYISKIDIELTAVSLYEVLSRGNVPFMLSLDGHIKELRDAAIKLFPGEQKRLLKEGIRIYRDFEPELLRIPEIKTAYAV